MRNSRNPQLERGEVRIEDIKLDHKCRDDMPTLLGGLQYLYSQETLRDRLFALLDEFILPGINKKVGRPGMAMWSILVLGLVKQGLGCDFDRLHDLANHHTVLRQFLGMTSGTKNSTNIRHWVTTHLWIPPCQVAFDRMRTCDRMRTFIRPQRCGDLMTAGRYGDACPETGPNQVQELTAR